MRIISGQYKGRRIVAPKNLPVRPTTDMAKESLFNILNNQLSFHDIRVLDLFSGTGNISYEFASRGVQDITSVDQNFNCIKFIKKTISELQFENEITPIKSDVFKFLEKTQYPYDCIFADPPYDFSEEQFLTIPNLVFQHNLLAPEGILIVEHSTFTNLSEHIYFLDKKKYGSVCLSFFQKTTL